MHYDDPRLTDGLLPYLLRPMAGYRACAALVLTVALSLGGAPAGARADERPCGVAGARLVTESRYAVVAKRRVGRVDPDVRRAVYYGCLRSAGRPVIVGRNDNYDDINEDSFRLKGRFVAVVQDNCIEACDSYISLFDLRRRREVFVESVGDDTSVRRLFLTARGAVAYVLDVVPYATPRYRAIVAKRSSAKRAKRVARAAKERDMPLASIRVRNNQLSWVFKGERQSVGLDRAKLQRGNDVGSATPIAWWLLAGATILVTLGVTGTRARRRQ